jgi:hypothetical protein
MVGVMSNAVASLVRKRLRCSRCDGRLGTYDVLFDHEYVILEITSQPTVDFQWRRGVEPEPKVYFIQEPEGRGRRGNRYRWKCGCGARPVLHANTISERWSRRDGTETV